DEAIINRIGLSNRGLEKTIQHLRRPHEGFIVGCNIGRNTATLAENAAADYLKLFRNLYQYADYFTVNISCDNSCREGATHTREHILRILDPLFDFRRGQNQYRPIMLKVSPDMPDAVIDEISDILLETPLDGIVATNGTHNREGLHTSRTTLDKIGSGRLSGAPLTQRAVEVVRRIHTRSGGNFPIIGVGGIMTPDDAKAMLDAGADLLQLYTGYIYNGPGLVRDICRALVADAEAKAAEEKAAAAQATAEQPAVQQAAAEQPAKEQPAPQSAETQPEAENAEPAPAESRTPAQSGPDSEQPES
ncbi:MAG: quinone-dependent dihydroorotate dehydrogenase, partial [Alistipes finegoldii]